jgi:hypothetical protein
MGAGEANADNSLMAEISYVKVSDSLISNAQKETEVSIRKSQIISTSIKTFTKPMMKQGQLNMFYSALHQVRQIARRQALNYYRLSLHLTRQQPWKIFSKQIQTSILQQLHQQEKHPGACKGFNIRNTSGWNLWTLCRQG